MSCTVYINRFDYTGIPRGGRKAAESKNGRELLARAVNDMYGIALSSLPIELGAHGKPYFGTRSEIKFNISHSGDYAAAAVSDCETGVDIQTMRPIKDSMIQKLCSDTELRYVSSSSDKSRAFIHLWALKESYIKAIGLGMTFPMDEINFDLSGFGGKITGRISNREGLYYLKDFGEFALAVCCIGSKTAAV